MERSFTGARTLPQRSLSLLYDASKSTATPIVAPPAGSTVTDVTISSDGSKIVYTLRDNEASTQDLHLVDVSTSKSTDTALTNDGKSRLPSF